MRKFFRFLIIIFAVIGAGFVGLMLMPDEWLSDDPSESGYESVYETDNESYVSQQGTLTAYSEAIDEYKSDDVYFAQLDGLREKRDYSDAQTVTILMYMNGSDLESEAGEASSDIAEMVRAKYNEDVNIIIQTMGTKKWSSRWKIASDHTQRYRVVEDGLELVDDSLGQLDCTDGRTLMDFINWGVNAYPADRYILMMWNHGGGPVYGFGYDEHQADDATLTVGEMRYAIAQTGVFFDFIGMDCCIMASLETCCALYDACDYMILSEDFESGLGWSYTGWINAIMDNPAMPTPELSKIIIDDFVRSNEQESDGDSGILALLDQSVIKILYSAWTDFAYANESALLGNNYSKKVIRKSSGRILPRMDRWGFFFDSDDANMADYYVTDIMAVAQNVDSPEKDALASALYNAIVYCNSTSDETALTGLSITLPYGDQDFYSELKNEFGRCGIDDDYIDWLEQFTYSEGADDYYNYSDWWDDDWDGWDSFDDDYDWLDWDDSYDNVGSWCDGDDCYYDDYGWDGDYFDEDAYDAAFDAWWEAIFGY